MPRIKSMWEGGYVSPAGWYIIRRSVAGIRYEVSTRCKTEKAAYAQLQRFEADPPGYSPSEAPKPVAALYWTEELTQEFLEWSKAQGNSHKWRLNQALHCKWWAGKLYRKDLRKLSLSNDIKPHLPAGLPSRGHRIAVLKAFFGWLRKHRNPALLSAAQDPTLHDLPVPKSKPAQHTKSRVLDMETVLALISKASKLPLKFKMALLVQAGTGWHVEATTRFAAAGEARLRPGKLGVLVTPGEKDGQAMAREVSARVFKAGRILLRLTGPSSKPFRGRRGFTYGGYYKALAKACEALGLPRILPGAFRHTVATHAVTHGATMEQVAVQYRHKDKRTTHRYTELLVVPPKIPTPV